MINVLKTEVAGDKRLEERGDALYIFFEHVARHVGEFSERFPQRVRAHAGATQNDDDAIFKHKLDDFAEGAHVQYDLEVVEVVAHGAKNNTANLFAGDYSSTCAEKCAANLDAAIAKPVGLSLVLRTAKEIQERVLKVLHNLLGDFGLALSTVPAPSMRGKQNVRK